jgi:hypothetical protein
MRIKEEKTGGKKQHARIFSLDEIEPRQNS